MQRTITTLLAILVLTGSVGAADWLQFRGNDNSGVAADAKIPTLWTDTQNIAWKVDLPGRGLSGPIVIGDRVVITASSGFNQDRQHVLCFDAKDGRPRWHRQFWATGRTLSHPKMCNATPTPASDGERIFAFYSSNDVICLDLDGNLQWFRGLTQDYPNVSNSLGMASSLIVVGDTLIVQAENDSESIAVGLDVVTGANRWKLDRPILANWTSPVVLKGKTPADDVVLLQSGKGLTAVEPRTGKQVWEYTTGCETIPSAVTSNGVVYVPSSGLTALEPEAGASSPKVLWQSARLRPITPSPLIYEDRIYSVGSGGVLTCGDIRSGEQLWQFRLKSGMYSASPVAANGHVYVFHEDGTGQVIKGGDKAEVVGTHEFKETILGTPAIAGNAMYVRSDGHLWKIAQ
jgi:outer membrane protein assembly factor BamB